MTAQLELKSFQAAPTDANVLELERILDEARGWLTASVICSKTGWHDRQVRELAEASPDVISGQLGYKHIRHASPEELAHFFHWMSSQAKKMWKRVQRVRRRAHQLVGA